MNFVDTCILCNVLARKLEGNKSKLFSEQIVCPQLQEEMVTEIQELETRGKRKKAGERGKAQSSDHKETIVPGELSVRVQVQQGI